MPVLLFYINYLIGRDLMIKKLFGYPHQKRKKPSLPSFRPVVRDGLVRAPQPAKSLNVSRSFSEYNRFSFHNFTDSHVVIPMGLAKRIPTLSLQGTTFLGMGIGRTTQNSAPMGRLPTSPKCATLSLDVSPPYAT